MENERRIEHRGIITPEKSLLLRFRLGKKVYNLEEIFSDTDRKTRRAGLDLRGSGVLTPGEEAAWMLMRGLEQTNLQISEYRRAMPHLFTIAKLAGRPEQNFDAAFIGNVCRIFDETAEKMGLVFYSKGGEALHNTFQWPIDRLGEDREQETFFARAYGYIECLREEIWTSPHKYDLGRFDQTRRERKKELQAKGLAHEWIASFRQSGR